MIDNDKNKRTTPDSKADTAGLPAPGQPISTTTICAPQKVAAPDSCLVKDVSDPNARAVEIKRDTKTPNRMFNFLNYFGLGFAANSTLSLYITYNLLPTEPVKRSIAALGEHGFKPILTAWYKNFRPSKLSGVNQLEHVNNKARSFAEICCMCIAGTIVLFPMKFMEDHRQGIVDKIDRWWNRDYYRLCAQTNVQPAPLPDEEQKQSWSRLLSARAIGVATVMGIDQGMEVFNNHRRHGKGNWNFDTIEWKAGAKAYDHMNPTMRERITDFFSRKQQGIESIQPLMQDRLKKVVGGEPKRMVFAEQARLLSKEVSLTLIMAGLVYLVSKTNILFKGDKHSETEAGSGAVTPTAPAASAGPDPLAEEIKKVYANDAKPRPRPEAPAELYTHKIAEGEPSLAPRGI